MYTHSMHNVVSVSVNRRSVGHDMSVESIVDLVSA